MGVCMKFPWLVIAALMGGSAVVLGAVGAHVVAGDDTARRYHDMAVSYQMYHVPALIAVSVLLYRGGRGAVAASLAGMLITFGVFLFSGSLYYLAWTGEAVGYNITPTGGMGLILGWLVLAIGAVQNWRSDK